ncbi:MAG: hypothetical protein ACXVJD_15435 [Mucilaginibacter sp.]
MKYLKALLVAVITVVTFGGAKAAAVAKAPAGVEVVQHERRPVVRRHKVVRHHRHVVRHRRVVRHTQR